MKNVKPRFTQMNMKATTSKNFTVFFYIHKEQFYIDNYVEPAMRSMKEGFNKENYLPSNKALMADEEEETQLISTSGQSSYLSTPATMLCQ